MITRMVNKLATLQKASMLLWFSTYDDFDDDGKGQGKKMVFFKRKQPQKVTQVNKEEPKQGEPHKHHFFQSKKLETNSPRRMQKLWRNDSKDDASTNNKSAPFINTVFEQEEQMSKKSIFFTHTPSKDESSKHHQTLEHQPQLKQLIRPTGTEDKFYQKFSQESSQVLSDFLDKNWKKLNSTLGDYLKLATRQEVEKLLYPVLISKNVMIFLQWQQSKQSQFQHLSPGILQKIYLAFINQSELSKIKELLAFLATKPINLNYSSIEALISTFDITKNVVEVQASVNYRINIALSILKVQFKYNEKLKASKQAYPQASLGGWFLKIANLALEKHICCETFLNVFQQIVIRHRQFINLEQLFESNLFMQIIEKYYFNSHIDTTKLFILFQKAITTRRWRVILEKFKRSLALFKIKHQKSAFPNAKNILKELERSLAKDQGENALFYYILAAHNDEPKAFQLLCSKSTSLFKNSRDSREGQKLIRLLMNDGLLRLSKDAIRSETSPKTQKTNSPDSENNTNDEEIKIEQSQIEKDYRTIIKEQIFEQNNNYRSQLLRMIFDQPALTGAKAAIKLGKLQLAFYICYKHYMSFRIMSRTRNDISHAVLALLLDANKEKYEPFLDDLKANIRPAVFQFNRKFIYEVYHKRQNLDYLLQKYFPKRTDLHQFWENQLILDRADELLKMDISNKLKDIKYQAEYNKQPLREKDQFMKQNQDKWRSRLMYELGIDDGRSSRPWVNDYIGWQERKPWVDYSKQTTEEVTSQEALNQPQAEVQEANSAEGTSQIAAEGDNIAQSTQDNLITKQVSQPVQHLNQANAEQIQAETAVNTQSIIVDQLLQAEQTEQAEQVQQVVQPEENIRAQFSQMFKKDQQLRIKGYDFNNFLEMARTKIRPIFQEQYEDDKQFKKTFLALQAIAQETNILDNHYLQKKLDECRAHIKNQGTIRVLKKFKLWHFDFLRVYSARAYPFRAKTFRQRFFNFKMYQGRHLAPQSFFTKPLQLEKFLRLRVISKKMINDMLIKEKKYFEEAEAVVKLKPCKDVQDLMIWGLQNDQPMAIYIAEKIAMITNQVIEHKVALRVGEYLSHRKDIPAERIQRCKECLKIVGRINRQHIYDFSKDYQHITTRKHFSKYLKKRQAELDSPNLEFLMRVNPLIQNKYEPIAQLNDLKRGRNLS